MQEALRYAASGDVALVFGTEMSGLSNTELSRCQIVATIPAEADFGSLNLAAAVQVAAYELRVAAHGDTVWKAPAFEPATQEEIELLFDQGERALIAIDFLRPAQPKRLLPRLRRLSRGRAWKKRRSTSFAASWRASRNRCKAAGAGEVTRLPVPLRILE